MLRQGDVFWVDLPKPSGSEPGCRRPCVVIQSNAFNRSRIGTVVVCAITSNRRLGASPGNVTLEAGEGGLARPSVINVSQIITADKDQLQKRIGALSQARVREVVEGVDLVIRPEPLDRSDA